MEDFNIGDKVKHKTYGIGKVVDFNRFLSYPLIVFFDNKSDSVCFTENGQYLENGEVVLEKIEIPFPIQGEKVFIPKGNAGNGCFGTFNIFQNDLYFCVEFNEGLTRDEFFTIKQLKELIANI